ncbi:hypothetical protein [Streptomyces sp. NPDC047061]|uniref:hypothetical protein n=1 Tax=Streptomyces sp. NPDC047061 TaxID=3154605 RepID=UPI0033C3880A
MSTGQRTAAVLHHDPSGPAVQDDPCPELAAELRWRRRTGLRGMRELRVRV